MISKIIIRLKKIFYAKFNMKGLKLIFKIIIHLKKKVWESLFNIDEIEIKIISTQEQVVSKPRRLMHAGGFLGKVNFFS
jgi:hypothetical protein